MDKVTNTFTHHSIIPRGLTARIAGFHPAGPGSTPGVGIILFIFYAIEHFRCMFVDVRKTTTKMIESLK